MKTLNEDGLLQAKERETSEGIIQAVTLILELQYENINLKSPSQYFAVADDESHLYYI